MNEMLKSKWNAFACNQEERRTLFAWNFLSVWGYPGEYGIIGSGGVKGEEDFGRLEVHLKKPLWAVCKAGKMNFLKRDMANLADFAVEGQAGLVEQGER